MILKFEQFNIEIENPTVEIDMNSIRDKAIYKLLSVSVVLVTDSARFGVMLEDMPYTTTWRDSNVEDMVNLKLLEYVLQE
jgi:hypothetical protein